jgi:hypothetical protein
MHCSRSGYAIEQDTNVIISVRDYSEDR